MVIDEVDHYDLEKKVHQIKTPGITSGILTRCTYDKTFEMIQPLVKKK
jgi:hypothetical protein